jgi:hypothetical protein
VASFFAPPVPEEEGFADLTDWLGKLDGDQVFAWSQFSQMLQVPIVPGLPIGNAPPRHVSSVPNMLAVLGCPGAGKTTVA